MNKEMEMIEVECECGDVHTLLPMTIFYDDKECFYRFFKKKHINHIRLFVNKCCVNDEVLKLFKSYVNNINLKLTITILDVFHAEEYFAKTILSCGEDYIIIFGDSNLIETIKFFACSESIPYSVILTNSFFDFTFSRFARLYDGINFGFYMVDAPENVFVFEEFLNKIDVYKYRQYIRLKHIAYFENVIASKFDDKLICDKLNKKLYKIKNKARVICEPKQILNAMIFLGRSMSLFNQTKCFFGAEIELSNQLEVISKKQFLDLYLVSGTAIKSIYEKALYSNLKILNFNMNKRIDKLKEILSLSITKVIRIIKKNNDVRVLEKRIRIILALKYMLLGLLDDGNEYLYDKIDAKQLSDAIYACPEFTSRDTFLNIIRDLGYLENLV